MVEEIVVGSMVSIFWEPDGWLKGMVVDISAIAGHLIRCDDGDLNLSLSCALVCTGLSCKIPDQV